MARVMQRRPAMRAYLIGMAALAACSDNEGPGVEPDAGPDAGPDAAPVVCHFQSGRPCVEGDICLGPQGGECNYAFCDPMSDDILGTAVACMRGQIDTTPAGPFDCDPALLQYQGYLPPPAPCPLGALYTIQNGAWGNCVAVSNCKPLPCNPAYGGDGCPIDYVCDAASSTCVLGS